MTNYLTGIFYGKRQPTAYLFRNGNAAYIDEEGNQIPELQLLQWCGLHEFVKKYKDCKVHIQAADPLEGELIEYFLSNIAKEPHETT